MANLLPKTFLIKVFSIKAPVNWLCDAVLFRGSLLDFRNYNIKAVLLVN